MGDSERGDRPGRRKDRSEREAILRQLGRDVAQGLCDRAFEIRSRALADLEGIYVSCGDGACVTHPEVARAAFPHALRALRDPDPEVRITGARAMELLATDARDGIQELASALADPDVAVRVAILEALAEFGPHAAVVAGAVKERLAHATAPEERMAAASVLDDEDDV